MQTLFTKPKTAGTANLVAAKLRRGREMSANTRQVLDVVRRYAMGITAVGIVVELPDAPENITKTLSNLQTLGHIINTGRRGASGMWMCKSSPHAKKFAASLSPGGGVNPIKSPERVAVEKALLNSGEKGLQIVEICRLTGLAPSVVLNTVNNLIAAGKADAVGCIGDKFYRLFAEVVKAQARPLVARISKMAGLYSGTELHRNPGLTPDRFTAFALPSRIGNRLHYPCGKTELIA